MNKSILFLSWLFFTTIFYGSSGPTPLSKSASVHQMTVERGFTPTPITVVTRSGSPVSRNSDRLGESVRETSHIQSRENSPNLQYLEEIFRNDRYQYYGIRMNTRFTPFEQQEFESFVRAWNRVKEIKKWHSVRNIEVDFRKSYNIPDNRRLTDDEFKALQRYIQFRRNEESQKKS